MSLTVVVDASGVKDTRTLSLALGTLVLNDVIIVTLSSEDANNFPINAPSASGVTFTSVFTDNTASHTWVGIYKGVVTAGGSKTVTATGTFGTGCMHNAVGYVCPTADGYSLAATPNSCDTRGTGAPSGTITGTSAGNLIIGIVGDWAAINGSSRAYRGTVTEDQYSFISGAATMYYWHQDAASGSNTIGLTTPTGQTFTIGAVEVLLTPPGTDSGPNYAGAASVLADGTFDWSGLEANAIGVPDSAYALATAP